MRELGREYFQFDQENNRLVGSETGLIISLGQRVLVRLSEATPVTGGIALELLEINGEATSKGPKRGRGRPVKRKMSAAKKKAAKAKRKVARKRK
jgi:ribonuclease R